MLYWSETTTDAMFSWWISFSLFHNIVITFCCGFGVFSTHDLKFVMKNEWMAPAGLFWGVFSRWLEMENERFIGVSFGWWRGGKRIFIDFHEDVEKRNADKAGRASCVTFPQTHLRFSLSWKFFTLKEFYIFQRFFSTSERRKSFNSQIYRFASTKDI